MGGRPSGGCIATDAGGGSSRNGTPRRTRSAGRSGRRSARGRPRDRAARGGTRAKAIRRDRPVSIVFEGRKRRRVRGRYRRFRARGRRRHDHGALVQIPPASRPVVHDGSCANCLMQIDGIPNVRACTEPVRDGMGVDRQNAWPSAGRDIHGWLNTFSFMMPPGFYYKVFQRPALGVAHGRAVHPFEGRPGHGPAGRGPRPAGGGEPPLRRARDRRRLGRARRGAEAAAAGADTLLLEQRPETDAEPGALAAAVDAGVRILTGDAGVRRVRRAARRGRESPRPLPGPPAAHRVRDRCRRAGGRVPEQRSAGDRALVGGGASDRDVPRPPGPARRGADVERGGVPHGPAPQGCRRGRHGRRSAPRRAGTGPTASTCAADRPSWRRTAGDGSPA